MERSLIQMGQDGAKNTWSNSIYIVVDTTLTGHLRMLLRFGSLKCIVTRTWYDLPNRGCRTTPFSACRSTTRQGIRGQEGFAFGDHMITYCKEVLIANIAQFLTLRFPLFHGKEMSSP